MSLLLIISITILINAIYSAGKLYFILKWKLHNKHYFLGIGPTLFKFQINGIMISLGVFIPIIFLNKIQRIENDEKTNISYIWEFKDILIIKRLLATFGGIISSFLIAIVLFTVINYLGKENIIPQKEVNRTGIYPSPLAFEAGFRTGDKILTVNNIPFEDFNKIALPLPGYSYQLDRNGKPVEITINDSITQNSEFYNGLFIYLNVPFEVSEVIKGAPADISGLNKGDRITAVNGKPILKLFEFKDAIDADEDGEVELIVERETVDKKHILIKKIQTGEDRRIGISTFEPINYEIKRKTLLEALVAGVYQPIKILENIKKAFFTLFGDSTTSSEIRAAGPIRISEEFSSTFSLKRVSYLLAYLMTITGIFNFLPLPKSEFWNLLPLVYEKFSRKVMSVEIYRKAKSTSYFILIAVMILVLGMDLIRLFSF